MRGALDYANNVLGYDNKHIILMGRSLGTGPCCLAASSVTKTTKDDDNAFAALILVSPYTSIKEAAAGLTQGDIFSVLIRHIVPCFWDSLHNIANIPNKTHVLIIHGKQDEIITVEHGQELFNASTTDLSHKTLVTPEYSTHNQFDELVDIIEPIKALLYNRLPRFV